MSTSKRNVLSLETEEHILCEIGDTLRSRCIGLVTIEFLDGTAGYMTKNAKQDKETAIARNKNTPHECAGPLVLGPHPVPGHLTNC